MRHYVFLDNAFNVATVSGQQACNMTARSSEVPDEQPRVLGERHSELAHDDHWIPRTERNYVGVKE